MAYVHGATQRNTNEVERQIRYYRDQAARLEAQLEAERTNSNKLRAALAASKVRSTQENARRDRVRQQTFSDPKFRDSFEQIRARNKRIYGDTPEHCRDRLLEATRELNPYENMSPAFDIRDCKKCGIPTRPKGQPQRLFPGSLQRGTADLCHRCYSETRRKERKKTQP